MNRTTDDDERVGHADWYKDAIIYQTHIKAFFDSNDDGVGDFQGLCRKLDYIAELGVTAIWILPFYPSPLRDDGYDISDYCKVNPQYGTLRDFRKFVRGCHDRNLKVITELVVNHTSDQHPWFQRARRSAAGSSARNFYVWSDSDQKYRGTRIIFVDTERSNWAWDPVAKAYYWHRFYSHQPDLNFDHPRVFREVIKVLNFWMDLGVDGMRLDAVPYLVEREGTNNENLPETHAVLKRFRAAIDQRYPDRMLLAEANQWPEDVRAYFGDGDECHMAFHFPLMPRVYMAIAEEDRHPITDIMSQTPSIPESCQWALFLRNHDELTLEMVTSRERDYLWRYYAEDPRARINLGIRRRLAPLMENDRNRIELMNALLFSMPGTPVLYYGDEIGMGDNLFLGDRDGVRTPMQWSPDRNGGFSRADPAQMYLPPVMNAQYGFEAINVEAQKRSPTSLLNWMRRLVSVRRDEPAFGRGSQEFLYPSNRKVLVHLRELQERVILCVFNLGRSAQAVELELANYRGRIPVELFGRSEFPQITETPYVLTLPGYGWYWFVLLMPEDVSGWHAPLPALKPEFATLVSKRGLSGIAEGAGKAALESKALPKYLALQRWFGGKAKSIKQVKLESIGLLPAGAPQLQGHWLARVFVGAGRGQQCYFLPLTLADEDQVDEGRGIVTSVVARVRQGSEMNALVDAVPQADFAHAVLKAMADGWTLEVNDARLAFQMEEPAIPVEWEGQSVRPLDVEQTNSSVLVGETAILKTYRRLVSGVNLDVEVSRFLQTTSFTNTPRLIGTVEYVDQRGRGTTLAAAFSYLVNQGDGWTYTLNYLDRELDTAALAADSDEPRFGLYMTLAETLGVRTAELHRALASGSRRGAFSVEPITEADVTRWTQDTVRLVHKAMRLLGLGKGWSPEANELSKKFVDCAPMLIAKLNGLESQFLGLSKIRIHGDFHLGQVLIHEGDWFILDFEGEPDRPLAGRRERRSPFKDVAGMLRSFDYALAYARRSAFARGAAPESAVEQAGDAWRTAVGEAFWKAYLSESEGAPGVPEDSSLARNLVTLMSLEKSLYEICYEASNRPDWIHIPVLGALRLLAEMGFIND